MSARWLLLGLLGFGCASQNQSVHPEMKKAEGMMDSQCGDEKLCMTQQCVPIAAAQQACATPGVVVFAAGSAEFTVRDQPTLDRLARCLKGDHHMRVRITGTADSTGTRQDNLALAGARSIAVAEYLKSRKVSSEQHRLAYF